MNGFLAIAGVISNRIFVVSSVGGVRVIVVCRLGVRAQVCRLGVGVQELGMWLGLGFRGLGFVTLGIRRSDCMVDASGVWRVESRAEGVGSCCILCVVLAWCVCIDVLRCCRTAAHMSHE